MRLLLAATIILLVLTLGSVALPTVPQKLCYFMIFGADDLGWTFSFNIGRVQTHAALRSMFPSVSLESVAVPNVYPLYSSGVDAYAYVVGWIRSGCTVLITNSNGLLGDDVTMTNILNNYTNVSFIALRDNSFESQQFPNRFPYQFDFSLGYYLAGVAMATEGVKKCVGFNAAWENSRNPVEAFNGFLMGLQSVDPTIKVEVINMNSWSDPTEEVRAAQLLVNGRGCDRIARYSDPRDVNVYIQGLANNSLLSLGPHSDLQQYVGDTVLISVFSNWSTFLIPLLSDLFTTGRFDFSRPRVQTIVTGGLIISSVSPLAVEGVQEAVSAAKAGLGSRTGAICGPGTFSFTDGSNITLPDASTCYNASYREVTFLQRSNVVYHGSWQAASLCAPGTYAVYNTQPTIKLQCTVCPANTYSTTAGSTSCTACPPGLFSTPNSTSCALPSATNNAGAIGGVAGGLSALLIIVVCAVFVLRAKNAKRNVNAPRSAPLALLFTDVEGSTQLWQAYPKSMSVAMVKHHEVIRRVIEDNGAYEIKTVGDSFMIATKTALDGVSLAVEIQRELQRAEWPTEFFYEPQWNGLKVRIGVHYCQDVEVRFEALHNYYDYYGNDVNLAARVESVARGGQILITKETFDHIRADEDFSAVLRSEIEATLFARNVVLKGLDDEFTLYSIVPTELSGRVFDPLEGHEQDTAGYDKGADDEGLGVKRSTSASSLSSISSLGATGLPTMVTKALKIVFDSVSRTTTRNVFKEFMGVDAGSRNVGRMSGIMARAIATKMATDGLHNYSAVASETKSPVTNFIGDEIESAA